MRLWSLHPQYLDAKGLVALWREALLAQKVLLGKTKGYRNHPQLDRFKKTRDPVASLGAYLSCVAEEARNRNYEFDASKIVKPSRAGKLKMPVSRGQLQYETKHLLGKLKIRDPKKWRLLNRQRLRPHPLFRVVPGPIEPWEKAI